MNTPDPRLSRTAVRVWLTLIVAVPAIVIAAVLVARYAPEGAAFSGSGPEAMIDRYIDSMADASDRLQEIDEWDAETREEFDAYFCSNVEENVRPQLDPTERWTDLYDAQGLDYRFELSLVELIQRDDETIAVLQWDGTFYWSGEETEQFEYRVRMREEDGGWCFAELRDPSDDYID